MKMYSNNGMFTFNQFKIDYSINQLILINNGNRTEWSPIRSVIIRVINKIGLPLRGRPIC